MLAQRCYGYRLDKWFELVERVVPWGQVGFALFTICLFVIFIPLLQNEQANLPSRQ